ncbi:YhfC family intramembrane metalloprotease [Stecheria sp. CLA-KB-P133]|uniref:YhfC family intramembrane metalloprotease n=1 Tax=Grylomicrobium aquisgranensis TaxID=2926318 RepID=A0AB35U9J5_9FIRM|nr:YhfC family intramembrane metalloprotease [Stecheria sp. CLA-KB-P133]
MSVFENIVIGKSAVPSLTITVILMIAIAVCFFICWRRKHKEQTKISWLIAGAAGFVISARILEAGVHYFCIVSDNPVSRFINGNTAAFVLYGITMAGIFEECGRHIILKYILKKDRTRENAVIYGIGHGGIEILTVFVPAMILYLAIAVMFSQGDTETALKTLNITEETAAAALPSVQAAAAFDYAMMAMNVMERLLAMLIQIGLTVIVYYGVVNAKKLCLPAAILLHMLADTFPALYQRGILPLWAVEIWIAFWTLMMMLIAAKLYKRMSEIVH